MTELLLTSEPHPAAHRPARLGIRTALPSDDVTFQWRDCAKYFALLLLRYMELIERHDKILHRCVPIFPRDPESSVRSLHVLPRVGTWTAGRHAEKVDHVLADAGSTFLVVSGEEPLQLKSNCANHEGHEGSRRKNLGFAVNLGPPPAHANKQESPVVEEFRRLAFEGVSDELQDPSKDKKDEGEPPQPMAKESG